MSLQSPRLEQSLIDFIQRRLLDRHASVELGPGDDLLGSGLVDSLGVMRLVNHIEEQHGIRVPPEDVTIENFLTVSRICSYLEKRRDGDGHTADS
jgi:acyl carrier protein